MKKALTVVGIVLLIMIFSVIAAACSNGGSDEQQEVETKAYTIQYTDNAGTHTLTVETNGVYSISKIPSKEGYTFEGLFDAEVGGTKYVAASGTALSAFTDKKNLILFAQFTPKEYTVELDYQGVPVTGSRELTVAYDSTISALPTNLTKEHATFAGWYTEPECGGTQVADQYGVIPRRAKLTSENFDLSSDIITLYAGFAPETYTVTFYDDLGRSEEVQVEYNTPIKEVVPDLRKDGMAVLSWSKRQNDVNGEAIFTGKVTDDIVLYVAEWAPVLEFDANGGKEVALIVAKADTALELPTPTKNNYSFAGWYTVGGVLFASTEMPAESMKLIAHWNAQLIFSTNGGTPVYMISAAAGTQIVLPSTEKEGYLFAGWYNDAGLKYEETVMPQDSLELTAKYYKIEKKKYVLISDTSAKSPDTQSPSMDRGRYDLNLTELYNIGVRHIIVNISYESKTTRSSVSSPKTTYMNWYSSLSASDAYAVWKYSESHTDNGYSTHTRKTGFDLTSPIIYICLFSNDLYNNYDLTGNHYGGTWKNFWVEVEYPDMSTLY